MRAPPLTSTPLEKAECIITQGSSALSFVEGGLQQHVVSVLAARAATSPSSFTTARLLRQSGAHLHRRRAADTAGCKLAETPSSRASRPRCRVVAPTAQAARMPTRLLVAGSAALCAALKREGSAGGGVTSVDDHVALNRQALPPQYSAGNPRLKTSTGSSPSKPSDFASSPASPAAGKADSSTNSPEAQQRYGGNSPTSPGANSTAVKTSKNSPARSSPSDTYGAPSSSRLSTTLEQELLPIQPPATSPRHPSSPARVPRRRRER